MVVSHSSLSAPADLRGGQAHCECFREAHCVRRLPPVGRGVKYKKYIVLRVLVQEYTCGELSGAHVSREDTVCQHCAHTPVHYACLWVGRGRGGGGEIIRTALRQDGAQHATHPLRPGGHNEFQPGDDHAVAARPAVVPQVLQAEAGGARRGPRGLASCLWPTARQHALLSGGVERAARGAERGGAARGDAGAQLARRAAAHPGRRLRERGPARAAAARAGVLALARHAGRRRAALRRAERAGTRHGGFLRRHGPHLPSRTGRRHRGGG